MQHSLDFFTLAEFACRAADEATVRQWQRNGLRELKPRHMRLLDLIGQQPVSSSDVARLLGVTQQATSRSIVELVTADLVEQRSSPPDRRIRRLELTARGRQAMEIARQVRADLAQEIVGHQGIGSPQELADALLLFSQHHSRPARRALPATAWAGAATATDDAL